MFFFFLNFAIFCHSNIYYFVYYFDVPLQFQTSLLYSLLYPFVNFRPFSYFFVCDSFQPLHSSSSSSNPFWWLAIFVCLYCSPKFHSEVRCGVLLFVSYVFSKMLLSLLMAHFLCCIFIFIPLLFPSSSPIIIFLANFNDLFIVFPLIPMYILFAKSTIKPALMYIFFYQIICIVFVPNYKNLVKDISSISILIPPNVRCHPLRYGDK